MTWDAKSAFDAQNMLGRNCPAAFVQPPPNGWLREFANFRQAALRASGVERLLKSSANHVAIYSLGYSHGQ